MAASNIVITNDPLYIPSPEDRRQLRFLSREIQIIPQKELNERLQQIKDNPAYHAFLRSKTLEPTYSQEFTAGKVARSSIIVTLVLVCIVAYALLVSGHLTTLPQDFMHMIQHINYTHLAIGGGIALVLLAGASIVIHRARKKHENLLGHEELKVTLSDGSTRIVNNMHEVPTDPLKGPVATKIEKTDALLDAPQRGAFCHMAKHLERGQMYYQNSKNAERHINVYIDRSTLNQEGTGKAYLYGVKSLSDHYFVSTIVPFFGTPFYLIGVIVYNIFRACIAPFYVIIQLLRECGGKQLYPRERRFEVADIAKVFFKSIWRVVRAPFFALAYLLAGVYSLVNPMGGRKLGCAIESDWNDGANIAEAFWSMQGSQELRRRDGSSGPLGMDLKRFFLAGCWQPMGIAEFEKGEIKAAYWLPKAVDPNYGNNYHKFYIASELDRVIKQSPENMQTLEAEVNAIQAELSRRTRLMI